MSVEPRNVQRQRRQAETKRQLILDAAREVFAEDGLEKASLRAIASRAGYAPAALYFHFASKEAIYAELLGTSLVALRGFVEHAVAGAATARERFHTAAMAFFFYYAHHPSEMDLGFYLFRGGMKPKGLDRDTDHRLNAALAAALQPVAEPARAMGAGTAQANAAMVDIFAHATGLLVLHHTGRIRMFGTSAEQLMDDYVVQQIERLGGTRTC